MWVGDLGIWITLRAVILLFYLRRARGLLTINYPIGMGSGFRMAGVGKHALSWANSSEVNHIV